MMTSGARQLDRNEATPFRLKRKGAFSEALAGYARLYTASLERGSNKIAELCFEQMFDTTLLMFLNEEKRFESSGELLKAIESKLCEALQVLGHRDVREFASRLAECASELFKRGRGVTRFSVDAGLLIAKDSTKQDNETDP